MDAPLKNCILHQTISIFEEDEELEPRMLFIEPPDPTVRSDEDSADEDDGGFVNNLTGRQLNAMCKVVLASTAKNTQEPADTEREAGPSTSSCGRSSPTLSRGSCRQARGSCKQTRGSRIQSHGSHASHSSSRTERKSTGRDENSNSESDSSHEDEPPPKILKKVNPSWINGDLSRQVPVFPEANSYRGKSTVKMLDLFLGDRIFNLLLDQPQKYAAFLNCIDPEISLEEMMKVLITILILSGYNTVPSKRHFWDQGEDMRNFLVYNSMRRDRFMTIMRFLHCADNNHMVATDKMWKLRPLIDIIKENFISHYVPSATLNYDESLIEYFGKHGCKQFITGKPIRFGYKNWCMNTPYGYLVNFEIYQGESIEENPDYDKIFGKAASPLIKMIDHFLENIKPYQQVSILTICSLVSSCQPVNDTQVKIYH